MQRKLIIIIIIPLFLLIIFPLTTQAKVPVIVYGEYLNDVVNVHEVWQIRANTQLELSLEKFMFQLFTALSTRQEEFLKTFELAKIEKAREDVNKLMFETQRELYDQGVIVNVPDPVTGKPVTIKKEGRVITNPDDFLFEEPIQKARDFVYCYLAPWKHFTWEDDRQYCGALGLTGDDCNSQNVCKFMPQDRPNGVSQCPSDETRDKLKQRLLNGLVRKEHKWAMAPPESWYTPAICEKVLNSFSCFDKDNCFTACDLQNQTCNINQLGKLTKEDAAKINNTHATLSNPVAYVKNNTIYELQQAAGNPNNNPAALEMSLQQQIDSIISNYQTLKQAQYAAGQGIRPEKYLIAFQDKSEGCRRYFHEENGKLVFTVRDDIDCKSRDEAFFGRTLDMNHGSENKSYKDSVFWFDTENIVSPAIVLLQKMAAATQAEFDLAQKAYKYPADQSTIISDQVTNTNSGFSGFIPSLRSTINELPAPWEDANLYAELPPEYSSDQIGAYPPELGLDYYLNRWYKDINQMYLPQSDTQDTFDKILRQWFCVENDNLGDCMEKRDPKYP